LPSLPPRAAVSAPELGRNTFGDTKPDLLLDFGGMSPTTPAPTRASFSCLPKTPSATSEVVARLLLVRHAQSANKCRAPGALAEADPGLTDLGFKQADALGQRLLKELRPVDSSTLTFVSSPMRRCLFTIQPGIRLFKPPRERVLCYAGCYEFGCAGTSKPGSSPQDIVREFPEFVPVGFSSKGTWDYQGSNPKETQDECRARGVRIVSWLREVALGARGRSDGRLQTIVLCTHQTIGDLLCTLLMGEAPSDWHYGDIRYRLQNAGITEVLMEQDGYCSFGVRNDSSHLLHLR